jgi:hypothetical protein
VIGFNVGSKRIGLKHKKLIGSDVLMVQSCKGAKIDVP